MNKISINLNGLLSKKITFKIDYNKHVHDIVAPLGW
jgi:hypothetical protein